MTVQHVLKEFPPVSSEHLTAEQTPPGETSVFSFSLLDLENGFLVCVCVCVCVCEGGGGGAHVCSCICGCVVKANYQFLLV